MFFLLAFTGGIACATKLPFPHTPSYSRPNTCPDHPVSYRGPDGQELRQGDAIRCSYADYGETRGINLKGRVLRENTNHFVGIPMEGLVISVHPDKGNFQKSLAAVDYQKWKAVSDAQGNFVLNVVLDPGQYLLVARDRASGENQAFRRIVVHRGHGPTLRDIDMVIPQDSRLQESIPIKSFPIELIPVPDPTSKQAEAVESKVSVLEQ